MRNEITLKEMQNIELVIMKKLHSICENNGLKYFLGYGSCIGAIRHKGFIPWDDDIDIVMPIEDYEKLINLLKNSNDRYQIRCMDNDDKYIYPFAKFVDTYTELDEFEMEAEPIGVYVDIFPIYHLPDDEKKRKSIFNYLQLIEHLCIVARKKKPVGKTIKTTIFQILLFPLAKLIGIKALNEKILKLAQKSNKNINSGFCSVLPPNYGIKECMSANVFDEKILYDFEDTKFYVPKLYDNYLTSLYGDYMKLPSTDKQVSHHHYYVKYLKKEN